MSSSSHLYNSLATGAILSGINYFAYKEPFDVKVLETSAAADYFALNVNRILPANLIQRVDPALLDNLSSELTYAGINYFTKFDQRSIVMQILMQASSSYITDMLLKNYYKQ
jgi:hypothetical protein